MTNEKPIKNPSFPDASSGRTKFYSFNWIGGGYNQVYARNKKDAIEIANAWFGDGPAKLRVRPDSVYETDARTYYNNLPYFD